MEQERKDYSELSEDKSGVRERIPFQVEADMRKGPPSSAVIRLHGDIDSKQSRMIERIISPLLKANVKYVVVDCSDVRKIDVAPIKVLINFAEKRKSSGLDYPCALTGLRPSVVETIKKAKPEKLFIVYKYFRDAVKSLKLRGLPDLYVAGTRPSGLNMRAMVKVVPIGGRAALVTPYGYIQQPEADLLGKILRRVSLMEVRNVVIDMTGISYANSHALGSLLNCASAWQRVYGRKAVALAGAKPGIRLALTTLGITRSTFMCDTVNEALGQLEEEENLSMEQEAAVPEEKPKEEPVEAVCEQPEMPEPESEPEPVKEEVASEDLYEQIASASDVEIAEEEVVAPRPQEHEETAFSILASKESADTDAWILKNVQSILKRGKKKDKTEEKAESSSKAKDKSKEKNKAGSNATSSKKQNRDAKSRKKDEKKGGK